MLIQKEFESRWRSILDMSGVSGPLLLSCELEISNTRDSVSSGYPDTEKRFKNTTRSGELCRNSSCLHSR